MLAFDGMGAAGLTCLLDSCACSAASWSLLVSGRQPSSALHARPLVPWRQQGHAAPGLPGPHDRGWQRIGRGGVHACSGLLLGCRCHRLTAQPCRHLVGRRQQDVPASGLRRGSDGSAGLQQRGRMRWVARMLHVDALMLCPSQNLLCRSFINNGRWNADCWAACLSPDAPQSPCLATTWSAWPPSSALLTASAEAAVGRQPPRPAAPT